MYVHCTVHVSPRGLSVGDAGLEPGTAYCTNAEQAESSFKGGGGMIIKLKEE